MLSLENYQELNKSFYKNNKSLFLYNWIEIGFTANLNWMINSILYCIYHKKYLVINTKGTYYNINNYFKKFWIEVQDLTNENITYLQNQKKIQKEKNNNFYFSTEDYLNNDFKNIRYFDYYKHINFYKSYFNLSNLKNITQYIINHYFILNNEFKNDVLQMYNKIIIPNNYIALHIRRGDKKNENDYTNINKYTNIIKNTNFKNIFVMTDDKSSINELKDKLTNEYNIFNNTYNILKDGFKLWKLHKHFINNNLVERYNNEEEYNILCSLFVEIKIAVKSNLFIGDFRSHVSATIGILKNNVEKTTINVISPHISSYNVILSKCYITYSNIMLKDEIQKKKKINSNKIKMILM